MVRVSGSLGLFSCVWVGYSSDVSSSSSSGSSGSGTLVSIVGYFPLANVRLYWILASASLVNIGSILIGSPVVE